MSKMGSHDPFGHLKHKLWPKEGLGIKLADATPSPLLDPQESNYVTKRKFEDLRVRSQHSALKGVDGRVKAPGLD